MPPKKTTKKKKKKTSGSTSTLISDLKDEVKTRLIYWQANFGHSGLKDKIGDMVNPEKFDTELLLAMVSRMQDWRTLIKDAKDDGELSSFVMPLTAAIAFEAVFQMCASFWLTSGDPPPSAGTLKKSVEDFIDMQVGAFGKCIGAA